MTSPATNRRIMVAELRIRIERVAVDAYVAVCAPPSRPNATNVARRLLFLVGLVEPGRQAEVHRLARLGGHVYRRTSDVLHGRTNALDLGDIVIDEWREVVEAMEKVLQP